VKILQRYKDVFDYNKDAAHFIANNGTFHDNKERKEVLQVDALYVKLNQENKEIGLQMKKRVQRAEDVKNREASKAKEKAIKMQQMLEHKRTSDPLKVNSEHINQIMNKIGLN